MNRALVDRLRSQETQRKQVEALDAALRQLPPSWQAILQLQVMADRPLSNEALGQMFQVDERTVRRWKNKALHRLDQLLSS